MIDDIKFEDDKILREWLDEYKAIFERKDYLNALEQIKTDSHICWGKGLKVLVVTDRCPGRAIGLTEYLVSKTDLSNVILLNSVNETKEYIKNNIFDILIFVGYQEEKQNYTIKDIISQKNPDVMIMMYALLDNHIKNACVENDIPFAYSSTLPIAKCVEYIKESYFYHSKNIKYKHDTFIENEVQCNKNNSINDKTSTKLKSVLYKKTKLKLHFWMKKIQWMIFLF